MQEKVYNQTTEEIREFLSERILRNSGEKLKKEELELLTRLKRDKVSEPVFYIGTGSCGMAAGAKRTMDAIARYLVEHNIEARIIEVGCIGLCSEEPLVDVQLPGKARVSFHHVTSEKVESLLHSIFAKTIDPDTVLCQHRCDTLEAWANIPYLEQLPWFNLQHKIVTRDSGITSPLSIADYIARNGYKPLYKAVLNYTPEMVCNFIEQSELKGRGGGGFLTGKKWKVSLTTAGEEKYLICNANESDPGAFMDRTIMEGSPHRLIEGIAIASYAIGSNNAFIYIRSDFPASHAILREAIRQANEYGILGHNIFGSGFNLNIEIREGAGAFVCGEETALISSLEGRRGQPSSKPPYPAETGLYGKPTIVNNVETLANVPGIIENGPAWFRNTGTKTSRGTKLFSLNGKIKRSGFIEVPMGTKLSDIIFKIGGGVRDDRKLKAIQIGGPYGVCIPDSLIHLEVGFDSLKEAGAMIGLGGLTILDDTVCMVDLSRYFMDFLQQESCGKCIPCREGTRRMLDILEGITRRPKEESSHETLERFKGVVQMETLAEVMKETSLCGLGQTAPNPVLSSLRWFRDEFEEHIFDRRCAAGVCRDLRTFYIDVDNCNGCNICQKKCPENAIIGVIKMPHFIVEEKCNGCGICFESCKFNAIYFK
jgi:NADH:ubiquinone oxidoreductase subunit F (NADH-binding)/Pyruvate/2-oxoacid:ferredoxin oxidoreductase delta subunit